MPSIESLIKDSQTLTSVFGAWPSFHDAEVIEFHFRRADVQPDDCDDSTFPQLTAKIRVLEATQPSANHAGDDILVALRFHCICDFKMERFDSNNQIVDLSISTECVSPAGEFLPSYFVVRFNSGCGSLTASFRCIHIEVIEVADAIPYPDV
jgi:hypothetical protein